MNNQFIFVGRLGKDPELKTGKNGTEYTQVSIAVDNYNSKTKEKGVDWFTVSAFGRTAAYVCSYGHKGDQVVVDGFVKNDNYEKDGQKVYGFQFMANSVKLFPRRGDADQSAPEQAQPAPVPDDDIPF